MEGWSIGLVIAMRDGKGSCDFDPA
jgi:hypothetical protein